MNMIKTTSEDISISFDNNYISFFNGNALIKKIAYSINREWSYKLLKTKIIISSVEEFTKLLQDELFSCPIKNLITKILTRIA